MPASLQHGHAGIGRCRREKRTVAEPQRQVEVQLGHLCNNRCVFCVSGQLSEQKRAPQLPAEPILAQLRTARANGAEKITFLGGEPTLQSTFLDLLRAAVDLDFAELVIFTNGVMTPKARFRNQVGEILDLLGPGRQQRVIWRFSLQGGTQDAHDATTCNPGAWKRIIESLQVLDGQGQRLSGNCCVVTSNAQSLPELADLASQYHFENLHLDMIRPRDAGDRTDAYLQTIMPKYSELRGPLAELESRLSSQKGDDFDLNFGNIPYCTMPELQHRIHHDGEDTVTVAADGQGKTQEGFNKYEDKRVDKHKPSGCSQCVFDGVCGGVFDKYRQFYGDSEFQPVTPALAWQLPLRGRLLPLLALPTLEPWLQSRAGRVVKSDEARGEIHIELQGYTFVVQATSVPIAAKPWLLARSDKMVLRAASQPRGAVDCAELHKQVLELFTLFSQECDLPPLRDLQLAHDAALRAARIRQQALQRARQQLALLVEQLTRQPLAGLQAGAASWQRDEVAVELRFGSGEQQVSLQITAELQDNGSWRPRFAHSAQGIGELTLQAFGQALSQRLRQALQVSERIMV